MSAPQIMPPRPWIKEWPAPVQVLEVTTPRVFRTTRGRHVASHNIEVHAGDWAQISPSGRECSVISARGIWFGHIEPLTEKHMKGPRPAHSYRANRPQGWRPS